MIQVVVEVGIEPGSLYIVWGVKVEQNGFELLRDCILKKWIRSLSLDIA